MTTATASQAFGWMPEALDGAELGDEMHLSLWLDANGPIDPRDCVGRRGPMHVIHVINVSKASDFRDRLAAGVASLREALSDAPGATERGPERAAKPRGQATRKRASEAPAKRGKAR